MSQQSQSQRFGRVVISFDLWNTLLFRNTEYNNSRIELIKDFLKDVVGLTFSTDHIQKALNEVKSIGDSLAKIGSQVHQEEMYAMLIQKILENNLPNNDIIHYSYQKSLSLKAEIDNLFLEDRFCFFPDCARITELMFVLKFDFPTIAFAIISNTGWIDGQIMHKKLENKYPEFYKQIYMAIFSGKTGVENIAPKPSPYIFRQIEKQLQPVNWFHIGDDPYSDGAVPGQFIDISKRTSAIGGLEIVQSILKGQF